MENVRIISTHICCTYETESFGLQTAQWPVLLVPPCSACGRPAFSSTQGLCGPCAEARHYNPHKHVLLPISCGQPWTESGSMSDDSGDWLQASVNRPSADPVHSQMQTWDLLCDLWLSCDRFCTWMRFKEKLWVNMIRINAISDGRNPNEICFGKRLTDFTMLADEMAWHFPGGIAVMHLEKRACLICSSGQPAETSYIKSAISWLRMSRGRTIGLAFKVIDNSLQVALVDVEYEPQHTHKELNETRNKISAAIASVLDAREVDQ